MKEIKDILGPDDPYDLSVIIVNYNTADLIVDCLNSIASQQGVNFEVILVDNASGDRSPDIVKNDYPWVNLLANKDNVGFAKANNQALKICNGRYVYYLNPDTRVRPGAFEHIVSFMDSHSEVGLAGTRIVNPDGSLQSSVEFRYPGQRHAKQELEGLKGEIAWVLGASMIGRRDLLEALDGFDERFFLYGEDLDLGLRVRKAGWFISYIQDAVVVHWGGQSERSNLPAEIWKKKFRAEFLFYGTHYSKRVIRAIQRANMLQAYWRILTIKIALPFSVNREKSISKFEKYKIALEMFKKIDTYSL